MIQYQYVSSRLNLWTKASNCYVVDMNVMYCRQITNNNLNINRMLDVHCVHRKKRYGYVFSLYAHCGFHIGTV